MGLFGAASSFAQDRRPQDPALRVAGLVQTKDGKPAARARVRLSAWTHPELPPTLSWALGDEGRIVIQGAADERGVFKVAVPHLGPFTLVGITADGDSAARRFPVMAGDFVTLTTRSYAVISGVVYQGDGKPAAGAHVVETSFTDEGVQRERRAQCAPPAETVADADGRFRLCVVSTDLASVVAGGRSLRASLDRRTTSEKLYRIDGQSLDGLQLRLDAPLQTRDRMGPPRPGSTRVRTKVVGPDGKGTRRRVLLAQLDPQAAMTAHVGWCVATDDDGTLAIEAMPGAPLYGFVEIDGRFVSFSSLVPTERPIDLGEMRAVGGRSLRGTVLAHDALRCGNVMVMLQPRLEVERVQSTRGGPSVLTRITYTDQAGRFRFDDVPPKPHRCAILAGTEGFHTFDVQADASDLGALSVPQTDTATGVIQMPDGSPAAYADVQYVPSDDAANSFGMLYLTARADADGRFVFRGLPRRSGFTVWAMATRDGHGFILNASNTVADDATGNDKLTLVLQPHSGRF